MATNRLNYRDSKQPRAVRVYTIAQESKYIIIENVPSLGIVNEMLVRCRLYGKVESYGLLDNHASSTDNHDVYLIKYDKIQSARLAKRKLDDQPFYNQLLRVSYAPEYEKSQDIRDKFQDRISSVTERLHALNKKKRLRNPPLKQKEDVIIADTSTANKKRRRI